jgi:hypothetical protein
MSDQPQMPESAKDLFYPAHVAVYQANLYSVRMCGRVSQNVLDYSFREISGFLVSFQHDRDPHPGLYIRTFRSIHDIILSVRSDSCNSVCREILPATAFLELLAAAAYARIVASHLR